MSISWKNYRAAYAMALMSTMLPHVSAAQNQGASLCTLQEEPVFACTLKNDRAVAVCASHPPDGSPGYLQYRFGKSGNVEINVPDKVDSGEWRKQFKAKWLWYSAGGGNYLRVDHGQYAYVVFGTFGRWGEKDGVKVWKSGAMVAHHGCMGPALSKLGPDLPSRWGIGEDPEELVLP